MSPLKSMGAESLLHYIRAGRGEPIILIHPLGAELVVWEPVVELLGAEREVIALDMPGFGASPPLPHNAAPTPQALAAAIGRFMDGLGMERAHMVGNSLGGWVALELAKTRRALSVTGLSSAGFWGRPLGERGGPDVRTLAHLLSPGLSAFARTRRGQRLLLRGTVGHPERVPPAAAAPLGAGVHAGAVVRERQRGHACDGLRRRGADRGAGDARVGRAGPPGHPPRRVPPGWRAYVLRGCGHVPTWDDPEQVAGLILRASASSR